MKVAPFACSTWLCLSLAAPALADSAKVSQCVDDAADYLMSKTDGLGASDIAAMSTLAENVDCALVVWDEKQENGVFCRIYSSLGGEGETCDDARELKALYPSFQYHVYVKNGGSWVEDDSTANFSDPTAENNDNDVFVDGDDDSNFVNVEVIEEDDANSFEQ